MSVASCWRGDNPIETSEEQERLSALNSHDEVLYQLRQLEITKAAIRYLQWPDIRQTIRPRADNAVPGVHFRGGCTAWPEPGSLKPRGGHHLEPQGSRAYSSAVPRVIFLRAPRSPRE